MQLPTRQTTRRARTASAARLDKKTSAYAKRLALPWQNRALAYYDQIGELRFAGQFYAKQLSRVRFYPATLKDDGSTEAIESGPAVELLDKIQDPAGGRSRLQFDYGRLMFVTGEGALFGDRLETDEERWRFLWREELKILDDGTAIRLKENKEETTERGVAYRMWTPHPRHSDLPDSPMQAVLDIAEELLILTASVRATATTRLTNGILGVPQELSPDPSDPGTDEDPRQNPFLAAFIDHVQAQIENPGEAAAKVPFLVEGAYEYMDRLTWVKMHDPATDYMERDLRIEAIKRLALGLDFPPEYLLGMTDANHWTAQQVQHDMWRTHGVPMAAQFASDLNQAYLRPALEKEGASWADVVVDFDDSQVVISPDRTTDADNAADRGMIGDVGYRLMKGIPEDYAPTKDEKELWAAIKTRDIPALDEALGIVNKAGPTPEPAAGNGNQPGTPPAPTQGRVVSRQEARIASIVGAAQLALRQCRSRAGARLRTHKDCGECREQTDGVLTSLVASTLGPDRVDVDAATLVKGGADEFKAHLLEFGIDPADALALANRVEFYAARSLFERQPEVPPGFVAQIEQALEVADALVDTAA